MTPEEIAEMCELYRARNQLVALLSRAYPSHLSVDPQEPDWPIICIHTVAGQLSWHIPKKDLDLFNLPYAPYDWDLQSPEELAWRIQELGVQMTGVPPTTNNARTQAAASAPPQDGPG